MTLSKVYISRTSDKAVALQSCFLPRYTNIMTDKRLNLFAEFAARCIHLTAQKEEYTSSSSWDSQNSTSDSIANSQRMLTEINKDI